MHLVENPVKVREVVHVPKKAPALNKLTEQLNGQDFCRGFSRMILFVSFISAAKINI